jgi:hypothetical protein
MHRHQGARRLGRGSSAPSPAAAMHLRSLWRGDTTSWLRGQGEVSLCVTTHSMVRTRSAVGDVVHIERVLLRSRASCLVGLAQRLLASAGGYMECLVIHCVVCASEPPSRPRAADSAAGVEGRSRHGAAGGVSSGCDGMAIGPACAHPCPPPLCVPGINDSQSGCTDGVLRYLEPLSDGPIADRPGCARKCIIPFLGCALCALTTRVSGARTADGAIRRRGGAEHTDHRSTASGGAAGCRARCEGRA